MDTYLAINLYIFAHSQGHGVNINIIQIRQTKYPDIWSREFTIVKPR